MIKLYKIAITGILAGLVITGTLRAQEDQEDNYASGIVASVSKLQIVLIESDFESDKEKKVTYIITKKTKLENVDSIEEIKPDQWVSIDYEVKLGKKIALKITLEPELDEESDTDDKAGDI